VVTVTVPSRAPTITVPRSFLGLCTEYWAMPTHEGHMAVFDRILSLIHARGSGPLVLRIGGD
jgi:hypothetical protein